MPCVGLKKGGFPMKHARKITAILLSVLLILTVFSGCGGSKKGSIEKITVSLPPATEAEQVVNVTAALAVNSYLTARAYLDRIAFYDLENMDEQSAKAFVGTLQKCVKSFEVSEQLAGALTEAAEVYEKSETPQKPTLISARIGDPGFLPGLTASAADDGGAKKWAQDIVDAYDAAPAGKAIRTLAEQLGTDAKHAYAQLKQALAVLEGAEYTAIADTANTAVKVATGLKAAGTAAGLVIAVAAAPAATTVGAIAQTGGIVCSGINTVLEVGTAGSIIYNNGEEDEIAVALQKTEAQFAPVGQIFSVMGLGLGLKDIGAAGKKILEGGFKSLSPKEAQDLGENAFGVLSYAASSLSDYINDGSILSGTFVKNKDGGVDFKLFQTMLGWDDQQMKDFLAKDDNLKKLEGIMDQISSAYKSAPAPENTAPAPDNTDPSPEPGNDEPEPGNDEPEPGNTEPTPGNDEPEPGNDEPEPENDAPEGAYPDGNIPEAIGEKIIERSEKADFPDDFDIQGYIDRLRAFLYELAGLTDDGDDEEPQPETAPADGLLTPADVAGSYSLSGTATLTGEDVFFENGTQSDDFHMAVTVTPGEGNTLHFHMVPEAGAYDADGTFDPETGSVSLTVDGLTTLTAVFSAEGDGVLLKMHLFAQGSDYTENADVEGYKQ